MSAAIWSGPSAFTQPAFGAIGKYDFKKMPTDQLAAAFRSSGMPTPTGIITDPGKVGRDQAIIPPSGESAVPEVDKSMQSWLEFSKAMSPIRMQEMAQASELSAQLTQRQLGQLYPFLSAAGAETTARNLAASQAYRRFAEGLPSNVQKIMGYKQDQATSAATAEAGRQHATAAQQQAAKDFAGRFAGQYIQVG